MGTDSFKKNEPGIPARHQGRNARTARLFAPPSTALARRLERLRRLGLIPGLIGGLFLGPFFFFHGADRTVILAPSTTARGRLRRFGAPGAFRFGPSAGTGGMGTRQGDATGADQACDTQAGKQFLQLLGFHHDLHWNYASKPSMPKPVRNT